jgi:hypothetical protein
LAVLARLSLNDEVLDEHDRKHLLEVWRALEPRSDSPPEKTP